MENTGVVKRKKDIKKPLNLTERHWTSFEVRDLPVGRQIDIAEQLQAYVRQKDVYTLSGFPGELRVNHATYKDWIARYAILKDAHQEAKTYLGSKRFNAGASGQARELMVRWAGQYDDEAFAYMERLEELKKKSQPEQGATVVNVYQKDFSKKEPA